MSEPVRWADVHDGDRVLLPAGTFEVARQGPRFCARPADGSGGWSPPAAVPPTAQAARLYRGPVTQAIEVFRSAGIDLQEMDS